MPGEPLPYEETTEAPTPAIPRRAAEQPGAAGSEKAQAPAGPHRGGPLNLSPWLVVPLSALAAGYVAVYLALGVARIGYPFELEWMEGGSVDHVQRILDGEGLYVRPSLEFVPYIYPPLYFYVAAAVAKLAGVGFLALRLVSFTASLGSLLVIFLLVRRETGRALFGLLSCGLFAATFRLGGAWFDIARVDSLFLLLILLAAYVARFGRSSRSALVAGSLAALSVLTKQAGLFVAAALAVYLVRRSWRHGAAFAAVVGTAVVGTTVLFNHWSDGWYARYVFELPREHDVLRDQFLRFWTKDLLPPLWPAMGLGALFLVSAARRDEDRDALWFYGLLAPAMVAAAWVGRIHSGGYDNVLVTAHAVLAVVFGLGARRLLQTGWPSGRAQVSAALMLSVGTVQFAALAYDPRDQVPSTADRAAGREMLRTLRRFEGEIWMPSHGHIPSKLGKRPFAQSFAMLDVIRAGDVELRSRLLEDMAGAVRSRRFAAVVVDSVNFPLTVLPPDFDQHYESRGPLFRSPDVFYPVTGAPVRPETLYVRRPRRARRPNRA